MNKSIGLFIFTALAVVMFIVPPANAEVHPGIRAGGYTSASGAFIGGDLLMPIGMRNWYFNPNFEYAFADKRKVATFNFDFHYDLPSDSSLYYWIGGGPAVVFTDWDAPILGNETDLGLNLLMGIGFNRGGSIIPYIQPKVLISDHSDFVIAFGLRF